MLDFSLLAGLVLSASVIVDPVYVGHNRISGSVQVAANQQAVLESVDSALVDLTDRSLTAREKTSVTGLVNSVKHVIAGSGASSVNTGGSVAVGNGAASGDASVAIGSGAVSRKDESAFGGVSTNEYGCVTVSGKDPDGKDYGRLVTRTVAVGAYASATADGATAIGAHSVSSGAGSIAIGSARTTSVTAKATAQNALAIGNASATNKYSVAIGDGAHSGAESAFQLGSGTNTGKRTLKFRDTVVVGTDGKIPASSIGGLPDTYTKAEADGRFMPAAASGTDIKVSSDPDSIWHGTTVYEAIDDHQNSIVGAYAMIDGKADRATTLSGYGIEDAYQVMSSAFSNDVASVVTNVVFVDEHISNFCSAPFFDYETVRMLQIVMRDHDDANGRYNLSLVTSDGALVGEGVIGDDDVVLGHDMTAREFDSSRTHVAPILLIEKVYDHQEKLIPGLVFTNDLDTAVSSLSNAVLNATAVAIGRSAVSTGSSSSGVGSSTAVGRSAIASSDFSTAFGYDAQATADYASAFGQSAHALAPHSTALGRNSLVTAAGTDSISVGWGSYCNRTNAVAIGHQAKVTGANAVQIGSGTNAQSASLKFRDTVVVNGGGKIPSASLEHSVSGVSFDFKGGENAVKVVYDQLTNVIKRLGGQVVNPIPFN